jgi:hypothetical protein
MSTARRWFLVGPAGEESPSGSASGVDKEYLNEAFAAGGAWLVGRTMHDLVDGWGEDPGFGVPVFVVTNRPRARRT